MAITSWRELGLDNRGAAKDLLIAGRYRSSISRSYYAAYCAVTSALAGNVTFGYGGNNPTHNELPNLIVSNLGGVTRTERYKIRKALVQLLKSRADADYVPTAVVGQSEALEAILQMESVFRLLEMEDE